jgi:hypothetical protein
VTESRAGASVAITTRCVKSALTRSFDMFGLPEWRRSE